MDDFLGIIVAIIIGLMTMTGINVISITTQEDHIVQEYVDMKTNQFVNTVRSNGYLSERMYEDYVEELMKTGNVYTIKITHEHTSYVPVYDDNNVFQNAYQTSYTKTYEKDIIDYIMTGENYTFSKNDYFYVDVSSKNITIANRIRQTFLNINPIEKSIHSTYGGGIRNEAD